MNDLISEIWSGLTSTITNLASAIKDVFLNLIYTDPSASTKTLSEFAKFGFLIMGVGLGFTTVWLIIRKIKG